ncbi:MAG: alpha/beta hydrolase [Haloechinothrix sp.]
MPLDPIFDQLLTRMPSLVGEGDTVQAVRQRLLEITANPALAELGPKIEDVTDTEIPGADGPIGARTYRPGTDGAHPTVVFLHGGGFAIGSIATHDLMCREICRQVDAVVVSVDYRLAPENPFPASVEDCVAATRWVSDHIAELGGDPDRLALAGDSAGGNLAAVVAQEFAGDDNAPAIAAQLLIYPATDVSKDYPSRAEFAEGYFLDQSSLELFALAYVTDFALLLDPRMSPILFPKLESLPPTVVITAEFDPIRDQGEAYATALEEAGVPVTSRRFDGMIHGFIHFGPFVPAAQSAVDETCALLRETLKS